jgi:hypothetical protein
MSINGTYAARGVATRCAEEAQRAAQEAQRAAQDAWWNALAPEAQAELSAQAEKALRVSNPFLFSRGEPNQGMMYRTLLEAERRRSRALNMRQDAVGADGAGVTLGWC